MPPPNRHFPRPTWGLATEAVVGPEVCDGIQRTIREAVLRCGGARRIAGGFEARRFLEGDHCALRRRVLVEARHEGEG
jgi:hypothetical protein